MATVKKKANVAPNAVVGKEEKAMANEPIVVEYETPKGYNAVDAIIWYQDNCLVGAPTIDGQLRKDLMVGGVNEADVKAGIAAELKMIEMADGNVWKGMSNLITAMSTTLEGIHPSEQVEVEGVDLMIDYGTRKIYTLYNEEIANLDDIEAKLPDEATKALLVERAKNKLIELEAQAHQYYDDVDEDDYYTYENEEYDM